MKCFLKFWGGKVEIFQDPFFISLNSATGSHVKSCVRLAPPLKKAGMKNNSYS